MVILYQKRYQVQREEHWRRRGKERTWLCEWRQPELEWLIQCPLELSLPPCARVVGDMSTQGHNTIKEGPTNLDQPQGPKIKGEGKEGSSELETFFHKNAVNAPESIIETNIGEIKTKLGF